MRTAPNQVLRRTTNDLPTRLSTASVHKACDANTTKRVAADPRLTREPAAPSGRHNNCLANATSMLSPASLRTSSPESGMSPDVL